MHQFLFRDAVVKLCFQLVLVTSKMAGLFAILSCCLPFRKAKVETMEADEEFVVTTGTEDDDEQTLDEEERMEEDTDHKNEIDNLQKEGIQKNILIPVFAVFSGHV